MGSYSDNKNVIVKITWDGIDFSCFSQTTSCKMLVYQARLVTNSKKKYEINMRRCLQMR